jgi:hypothetical protein
LRPSPIQWRSFFDPNQFSLSYQHTTMSMDLDSVSMAPAAQREVTNAT